MYKKGRGRRRRGGVLKKATRAGAKARAYSKNAKVASVVAVAKSVNRLRKQVRRQTELKTWYNADAIGSICGQVSGNNTGMIMYELDAFKMPTGLDDLNNRVGRSVIAKGYQLRFQFSQQSATTTPCKYIIEVWRTRDFGTSLIGMRDRVFEPDSISTVVDYYSSYNKNQKEYKCIGRKTFTLQADNYSGITNIKDIKMFMKMNQELVYSAGSSNIVPDNMRLILTVRASVGNNASTTSSTLPNVVITAPLTGSIVRFVSKGWFVDS